MAQTQGLKGYLTGRLNVDTAYMAEFIKGLDVYKRQLMYNISGCHV